MSMIFDKPNCPECGKLAMGTVDVIPGAALLNFAEDGSADWAGETALFWDGQTTERVGDDPILQCEDGHTWASKMTENEL